MTGRRACRLLGGLTVVLLACGAPAREQAPGLVTLKVSGGRDFSRASLVLADAEGFFADQGLEIELVNLPGSSSQAIPALIRGQVDVIVGPLSIGMFNAMANGAPIRFVAGMGRFVADSCVTHALVARRSLAESGALAAPESLRGRRIAVNPINEDGYYVDGILRRGGLTLADVDVVTVPQAAKLEALNSGAVDLVATFGPQLLQMLDQGHVIYAAAKDIRPGMEFSVMLFGPRFLEQDPDLGRRFMTAYLEGVRRYSEGKSERNLATLEAEIGWSRDLLLRTCWRFVPPDGSMDLRSLVEFQSWAVGNGQLSRPVGEGEMWDPRFAEAAFRAVAGRSEP